MQIITPITIDLINPYPLLNFNLKQGDSGRGILVTVTANGANVEFTTETVNIYVKKPDGTIIYNACTVSGNQVRAMFTNQALAVAGNAQVELEIISQDDTISTPIACIDILPTNIDSEAIESSNEFTALTEALKQVQNIDNTYVKIKDYITNMEINALDDDVSDIPDSENILLQLSEKIDTKADNMTLSSGFLQLTSDGDPIGSAIGLPEGGGGGTTIETIDSTEINDLFEEE